ncbi:MAG: ribonuclease HIII [Victivallaceae bacterium]|nr:ribonuclease HIII [Victivallaceae bacterium]
MPDIRKNCVFSINDAQRAVLEDYCRDRGWQFDNAPYAYWKVKGDGLSLVAYESGKLTVQGKKAAEFIEFVLETTILDSIGSSSGAASETAETAPEPIAPHGGVDESGKGDFFGPLVVAGAYVTAETAPQLVAIGVKDSKLIKSTTQIYAIAPRIRRILDRRYTVVTVGNEAYNRLYRKIGNLNRLLAWGHARVIENLLAAAPECPRVLSDKFGNESLIRRALMEKGRQIILDQQTKAESDVAVAAASILAREGFLRAMDSLSVEVGRSLPRGASAAVTACAKELAMKNGLEFLEKCAKTHFKTYDILKAKVAGGE